MKTGFSRLCEQSVVFFEGRTAVAGSNSGDGPTGLAARAVCSNFVVKAVGRLQLMWGGFGGGEMVEKGRHGAARLPDTARPMHHPDTFSWLGLGCAPDDLQSEMCMDSKS